MFEYPSESSLAEEEDEEEGHASETEEEKSRTFHIPRPNSTLHPSTPNSDLSSYTPKHSVKFSEWQEQKYEEMPASERPPLKEADSHGNQVMLTPAEKGGLSDFSSEPALYFWSLRPVACSSSCWTEPVSAPPETPRKHHRNKLLRPSLITVFIGSWCQGWTRCHWVSMEDICTGFWDLTTTFRAYDLFYLWPCIYSLFKISCRLDKPLKNPSVIQDGCRFS